MARMPKKVEDRLVSGLKIFQPILSDAKNRDLNESDTVTIVTDMLADLFGYDKYAEVTSEYATRSGYCDLAIKIDNKTRFLIEVKRVDANLREKHTRQAVGYATEQGLDWIALTNGATWIVYHITFAKPINQERVISLDLLKLNPRSSKDIESLWPLTREGLLKSAFADHHTRRQAMDRFSLAAILLSDPGLKFVRKELKRLAPGIKITTNQIKTVLMAEVLKGEVVKGEEAEDAIKQVQKANKKWIRKKRKRARIEDADEDEDKGEGEESIENEDSDEDI